MPRIYLGACCAIQRSNIGTAMPNSAHQCYPTYSLILDTSTQISARYWSCSLEASLVKSTSRHIPWWAHACYDFS